MSKYLYWRGCPGCSSDSQVRSNVEASLLVFLSSLGEGRRQKSSGSLALCADCISKICDGEPLPQKLRDGIADACKALGIELQRALPLEVKPAKKKGRNDLTK
jgi:hypothetical protein